MACPFIDAWRRNASGFLILPCGREIEWEIECGRERVCECWCGWVGVLACGCVSESGRDRHKNSHTKSKQDWMCYMTSNNLTCRDLSGWSCTEFWPFPWFPVWLWLWRLLLCIFTILLLLYVPLKSVLTPIVFWPIIGTSVFFCLEEDSGTTTATRCTPHAINSTIKLNY